MQVLKNLNQALTLKGAHEKKGRNLTPDDLGLIDRAAIVIENEKILWVGIQSELPEKYKNAEVIDCQGLVATPEIVDSHTHVVFGGNRSEEYSMRLNGADYQEIAKAGGGILSTMKMTRETSRDELFKKACESIERIHSYGVGTIEIKSGYGQTYEKEKELTLIIDDLKKHFAPKIQIKNTYLAAHAVPKDYKSSKDYMNQVVLPLFKELTEMNVLDAVDIFHEEGYFSTEDTRALFDLATERNVAVKSHADEFVDNLGAILACEYGALSTDHLLATTDDGIKKLSESSTVATLLPGTGYFLGKSQASARKFLDGGCQVAIASDYNPGSCHCDNLPLIASLAAPNLKLNQTELWAAITLNTSHALGLKDQGALVPGLKSRISLFECENLHEITYFWGRNFFKKHVFKEEI